MPKKKSDKLPPESASEESIERLPTERYQVLVNAQAESTMRGANPESIDPLLKQPDKNTASLYYKTLVVHVESLLKKKDVDGAIQAIQASQDTNFQYKAPLNKFKRDPYNANAPFVGAHALIGALRDAAKFLYDPFYPNKREDGSTRPAAQHFRKSVQVRPHHIFFFREGSPPELIKEVDREFGQQPSQAVKGFARYEELDPPFTFNFTIDIEPQGPFEDLLTNKQAVVKVINQAARHGLGASRGMGCGQWVPLKINFRHDTPAT